MCFDSFDVSCLHFQHHVAVAGQTAQVDDGVAHAAEGGVDAHSRFFGYVLELVFAVVAQYHHASLFVGEFLNEFAYVLTSLVFDYHFFHIVVEHAQVFELKVVFVYRGQFANPPEMVNDKIVCNAHHPVYELVLVFVHTRVDGLYHF